MIESLVPPRSLDNDVAVMKIIHLMGQLSEKDVKYVYDVISEVVKATELDVDGRC